MRIDTAVGIAKVGSCLLFPLLDITLHASFCVVKHSVVLKTSWTVGSIAYDTLNYVFSTAGGGGEKGRCGSMSLLYTL